MTLAGTFKVSQSIHQADLFVRKYSSELHASDGVAWDALRDGFVGPSDAVSPWTAVGGYGSVMAFAVDSPILPGYPGVIVVVRDAAEPAFDADDAHKLQEQAGDVSASIHRTASGSGARPAGHEDGGNGSDEMGLNGNPPTPTNGITHAYAGHSADDRSFAHSNVEAAAGDASVNRVFIFNETGRVIWPQQGTHSLKPRLAENLSDAASRMMHRSRTKDVSVSVGIADADGEKHPFELNRLPEDPARGPAVVVACAHPQPGEWALIDKKDFEADIELARLMPAIHYMLENFNRGPTLGDLSECVQLSQFHFHRRFSELMGITPKHLLFDLQLDLAKRLLADPEQELAAIAKECGFAHQSHFTSRFKQGSGLTPTRWRRVMRSRGQHPGDD